MPVSTKKATRTNTFAVNKAGKKVYASSKSKGKGGGGG